MNNNVSSELLESVRFAPERSLQERMRARFGVAEAYARIPEDVRAKSEDVLSGVRLRHVRVTARMAPELHRVVGEACERLHLPTDVELLVDSDESINAAAFPVPAGTSTRVVALTAGAIKQLSPLQLRCVVGHELGHVAYGHPQFLRELELIYRDEEVPNLLGSQHRILGRLQEFSADRAGLVAVDRDLAVAAEVELRVATGLGPEHVRLDLAAYLDEVARIESFEAPDQLFTLSHPLMPLRIRALQLFASGDGHDDAILSLARLMDFDAGSDEARATRDLLLSGGLLAAHADGCELDDSERARLEDLVLPFTDDPEELLSRVQDVDDAVALFEKSAAWIREHLGPERYEVFEQLVEIVLHDGEVTEGEWDFLVQAGSQLEIPGPWIARRLARHDEEQARQIAPPRAFGLRFQEEGSE
jgi:Zn-dependent protease with chaperone function/uncharacterized tellurite resistance protein B-like protein